MNQQTTFAASVLKGIGAPINNRTIAAFIGWAKAEGGDNWTRHNPLNTTESMGSIGTINSAGVKRYPSDQAGVAATVKTLRNGFYGGIISAFKSSDPGGIGRAIASSPWGTGALAEQTIAQAEGQHFSIPAGGYGVPAAAQGGTSGPSSLTSTITTGGVPDVQAALKAAMESQLQRPIDVTTGKLPSGDSFLKDFNFDLNSGQYLTPQVNHTLNAPLPPQGSSSASSGKSSLPQNSGQYPVGVGTFDGKPVALWIIPILQYARSHGWNGSVTSGYRSLAQQTAIYNSGVRPAAVPGTSNHESNRFPGGAVDVTNASGLSAILRRSPYASVLIWAGTKDPVHFSHPHNGSY